jgi:hypothetical protein
MLTSAIYGDSEQAGIGEEVSGVKPIFNCPHKLGEL